MTTHTIQLVPGEYCWWSECSCGDFKSVKRHYWEHALYQGDLHVQGLPVVNRECAGPTSRLGSSGDPAA